MPYANPAQQKAYLSKYRKTRIGSSKKARQIESNRKKAWYAAHQEREKAKRRARNEQDRHLLAENIPVVIMDHRNQRGHVVLRRPWEKLSPIQVIQCFHRDGNGILHLRTEKQQIEWLIKHADFTGKSYSVIRNKIWFNKDIVMTVQELKELASRLSKR